MCSSDLKQDFGTPNASTGELIETLVHNHCMRLKYKLHPTNDFSLCYWRNKKDQEIDIIMDLKSLVIPIEIKYQNKIDSSVINIINEFISQNKERSHFGIVVTKNSLFYTNKVLGIPAWLFLIIC